MRYREVFSICMYVCMYATFILRMLLTTTSCTMNSEPPPSAHSNSDTTHDTITIPEVSSTKDAKQGTHTYTSMHTYIHTYIHTQYPNGSSTIQVNIHTYIYTLT